MAKDLDQAAHLQLSNFGIAPSSARCETDQNIRYIQQKYGEKKTGSERNITKVNVYPSINRDSLDIARLKSLRNNLRNSAATPDDGRRGHNWIDG